MELQTHLMGRSGKDTFWVQSTYSRATDNVFQIARASWLIGAWTVQGAESVQESQPPLWGKQPIIMYLARNHQTSEGSFLEKGRRLRQAALLSAACCTFTLRRKGREDGGFNSFLQRTEQAAGDPRQGSVPFDASVMGGIPKELCHFNTVPGTQSDHEWLLDDVIH